MEELQRRFKGLKAQALLLDRAADCLSPESWERSELQRQGERLQSLQEQLEALASPPADSAIKPQRGLLNWRSSCFYSHPHESMVKRQPDPFHQLPSALRPRLAHTPLPWGMAAAG